MESNLRGRIKNVVLSKANGLLPLFEAVVNSVQAIEDQFISGDEISELGKIDIFIRRQDDQVNIGFASDSRADSPITSFEIVDNGIGFNDENWKSFQALDFTQKAARGCRGVGRLMWLKAFSSVQVESGYYNADNVMEGRQFHFTTEKEVTLKDIPVNAPIGTVGSKVILYGFQEKYAQSVEKTAEAIAAKLLEHLLWYYVRANGVPNIIVHDGTEKPLHLSEIFKLEMQSTAKNDDFEVKGVNFNVTHIKLRAKVPRKHVIAYCAAQRLVKEEALEIPGLSNSISDDVGPFRYVGYVVGDYLDQRVHPERTDIEMEEETNDLFTASEVSRSDLREALRPLIKTYLGDALEKNLTAGRERLDTYIRDIAPQYLPIVKNLPDNSITVDPDVTDAHLDKLLHGKKYELEQQLLEKGENLLRPSLSDHYEDYYERVSSYIADLNQVKQSDLAAYVAHRRVVIDLLRKAMEIQEDGKYAHEKVLHSLIMPMGKTSTDIESLRGSNLWLVDERLAFHQHYLGSDKSLSSIPVTGASGGKEPDLMGLNIYENPHIFSDQEDGQQPTITIVEIKRPMKGDHRLGEETNPIQQAYSYLERIRAGGLLTKTGRHIPNADTIPAHVYVIADLTPSLRKLCEYAGLKPTPDGMGYFGFNDSPSIRAYTEVTDFQGVLSHATQLNAAFFDQLGLPSSR